MKRRKILKNLAGLPLVAPLLNAQAIAGTSMEGQPAHPGRVGTVRR